MLLLYLSYGYPGPMIDDGETTYVPHESGQSGQEYILEGTRPGTQYLAREDGSAVIYRTLPTRR